MSMDLLLAVISVGAAVISGYYAKKSYENFKYGHMPVLVPIVEDVKDPNRVKLRIDNEGRGVAKNIKARWLDKEQAFATDLLPKETGSYHIKLEFKATFENNDPSKNKLFTNPIFELTYTDMFGKNLKTTSRFKPDVMEERRKLGHIDINFVGHEFIGYS